MKRRHQKVAYIFKAAHWHVLDVIREGEFAASQPVWEEEDDHGVADFGTRENIIR
jgi:hypothetical protein